MHYCLSIDELDEFVDAELDNRPIHVDLKHRRELAADWQDGLHCMGYFLAQVLERRKKRDSNFCAVSQEYIDQVYDLQNSMYFIVQEFDSEYIDLLLHSLRSASMSLEEELISKQDLYVSHEYASTFRY